MKKLLLFFLLLSAAGGMNAALPEPTVSVLPNPYDWFDGFGVKWMASQQTPCTLSLVNAKDITVTKNLVEDIDVFVGLTEFQYDEDTPNYENAQLVVTLAMLESDINATYTLTIPAGAVNVNVNGESVPCDEVNYSFQLQSSNATTLPEPNITPAPGEVSELSVVKMNWTGKLGSLDLLNIVSDVDDTAPVQNIAVTYNGQPMDAPEVGFEWSSRLVATEGSAGDIFVITLSQENLPVGTYVIKIPENYLQISDIETGTLYNDVIEFSYVVNENSNSIESLIIGKDKDVIYNLNGVKMNSANINELPKGVYIINGKKIQN